MKLKLIALLALTMVMGTAMAQKLPPLIQARPTLPFSVRTVKAPSRWLKLYTAVRKKKAEPCLAVPKHLVKYGV